MRFLRIASLVLATSLLTASLSMGQARRPQPQATPPATPQEVSQNDVIRVDTELVTLTATVTDQRGRYIAPPSWQGAATSTMVDLSLV